MSTEPNSTKATKPVETVEEELKRLELEIKRKTLEDLQLQKQEREYNMLDLKRRIDDRGIRETQLREDREAQGRTFQQQDATDKYRQSICTHKKGGMAHARDVRVLSTGGNANQYAVIKHQMINGDVWVRCLRCGKTWSPPVESNFYFANGRQVAPRDGKFDAAKFEATRLEYIRATQFETNNSMSGSVQCRFLRYNPDTGKQEDAADVYRENIKDTTLR